MAHTHSGTEQYKIIPATCFNRNGEGNEMKMACRLCNLKIKGYHWLRATLSPLTKELESPLQWLIANPHFFEISYMDASVNTVFTIISVSFYLMVMDLVPSKAASIVCTNTCVSAYTSHNSVERGYDCNMHFMFYCWWLCLTPWANDDACCNHLHKFGNEEFNRVVISQKTHIALCLVACFRYSHPDSLGFFLYS